MSAPAFGELKVWCGVMDHKKIICISALEVQDGGGVWSIGGTSPGEWISKKWELDRGLKIYAEMVLRPGAAEGGSP